MVFGVVKANLLNQSFAGSGPCVTDLDGNGRLDLIVGKLDGTMSHYQQSAVNSATFTLVTDYFIGLDAGFLSCHSKAREPSTKEVTSKPVGAFVPVRRDAHFVRSNSTNSGGFSTRAFLLSKKAVLCMLLIIALN
jgi:hypothetical protein